jgi:hypothetical protein
MASPTPDPIVPVVQHPADVLARARCLAASALVVFSGGDDELMRRAENLVDGIEASLTGLERRALDGEPLARPEASRLSWQTVSADVLLWAIGRNQAPPSGEHAPQARPLIDGLIAQPELSGDDHLRPMTELREFAREVRAWAWGTRDEQLVRSTGSTSIQQPVPDNARLIVDHVHRSPAGDDLVVDGVPLRDVDDSRLDELISINSERLRASRWLLAETEWDAVALKV